MPTWQPTWEDVRFDHHAAAAAVEALRMAAQLLELHAVQRRTAAAQATTHWQGRHRQRFDEALARSLQDGGKLADDLVRAALELAAAGETARTEQARRVAERDEWNRQLLEEMQASPVAVGVW